MALDEIDRAQTQEAAVQVAEGALAAEVAALVEAELVAAGEICLL